MGGTKHIEAAEALLVDRIFHALNAEVLQWTLIHCPNPFPEGRARDIEAILRSRREAMRRIAPIWC